MQLKIPTIVEAPDGASHFYGSIDDMSFYKMKSVGAVGEHWFTWSETSRAWMFCSHHKPQNIMEIPKEWME